MNSDTLAGKLDKTKGKAKSAVGEATGDSSLKSKGTLDKVSGAIQKGVGDVREKVEKTINELKK